MRKHADERVLFPQLLFAGPCLDLVCTLGEGLRYGPFSNMGRGRKSAESKNERGKAASASRPFALPSVATNSPAAADWVQLSSRPELDEAYPLGRRKPLLATR